MKNRTVFLLLVSLLNLLGIAMIYLGIKAGILPPALTGIGFLIIAWVFLNTQNKKQ